MTWLRKYGVMRREEVHPFNVGNLKYKELDNSYEDKPIANGKLDEFECDPRMWPLV